jgi:glutathione S-transferase
MFTRSERFLMRGLMIIETTPHCPQTPRILLLLEELEAPYELVVYAAGHFQAHHGRPGPRLVDGEVTLFPCTAMLRHCARTVGGGRLLPTTVRELARLDAMLELPDLIGLAMMAWRREEQEQEPLRRPTRIAEAKAKLHRLLESVQAALDESDGDWLLGEFGLADCGMAPLATLSRVAETESLPRLRAYAERLALRVAYRRAELRLEQAGHSGPWAPTSSP